MIDELRYYSVPISSVDAKIAYGDGYGDLVQFPSLMLLVNQEGNSNSTSSFKLANGELSNVTGFDANDIEVFGGQVSGFSDFNSTHYQFNVIAEKKPQRIKITIPAGSAKDEGNFSIASGFARIQHLEPVTGAENLVGWWTFDEVSNQIWDENSTPAATSDGWTPLSLSPKVWLDASDLSSLDQGSSLGAIGVPSNGNSIEFWADKSGNDHYALKKAGNPSYNSIGLNSKPTIQLTNSSLVLNNSRSPFDNWDELHVFAVLYQTAHSQFSSIFGKTNHTGWANSNSHNFSWFLNMHRSDKNSHKIWGPALNTSSGGNSYMTTSNNAIWTHDGFGGGPSVISISYSSFEEENNFKFFINGQLVSQSSLSGSIKTTSNVDFVIGGRSDGSGNWKGNISEFILLDEVLEDDKVELYLQSKWIASAEPLHDSENSSAVFEDQSGGDRPLFFYGLEQNNQSLFGASLGFDGATNFGKIELRTATSVKYL